jgi:transposase-like protein
MKRTRHSPEQIIAKLREADARLASGASIGQVCQQLGVSEATFHRSPRRLWGDEGRRGATDDGLVDPVAEIGSISQKLHP